MKQLWEQNGRWRTYPKWEKLCLDNGYSDKTQIRKFFVDYVQHNEKVTRPKPIYIPIYSRTGGEFQFDTLTQKEGDQFLIFVNINTRKAWAYPMKSKGEEHVYPVMQRFLQQAGETVKSLFSDQDPSYDTERMIKLYQDNGINHYTTTKGDHHRLGKINRLIRTLRDLHGPTKTFSDTDMEACISNYNESVHSDIGVAPNEMTKSKEFEYVKKTEEKVKDLKQHDYGLRKGDFVRVVLDKKALEKHRNDLSVVSYKIAQLDGYQYVIQAKDLSVEKLPGWKLIICKDQRKYPWAESINDDKVAFIDHIVSAPDEDHYIVKFDNEKSNQTITINKVREGNQTRLSLEERRYWAKVAHLGTPEENLNLVPQYIKNMIPKVITK
jgi:hypothetical protein